MENIVLIGNGPSSTSQKLGDIINSFDIVVRFNNFILSGYEEFIGTKTDIWAVNLGFVDENRWNHNFLQPRTIVYCPYTLEQYDNYEKTKKKIIPGSKYEMCPIEIAKESDRFYQGNVWASTGLMAILHFKSCYILGFDNFSLNKHHYGDNKVGISHHKHHNSDQERRFIQEEISKGNVKILTI